MENPPHYWLGVASSEHVLRGVALGIAQIGHGKRGGLARMHAGDGLIYYSPRASLNSTAPLRRFTAVGIITDSEIWQRDEDEEFKPWRRRVTFDANADSIDLADLSDDLDFTRAPNWGYALRRGLVPLTRHDFELIREAMNKRVSASE